MTVYYSLCILLSSTAASLSHWISGATQAQQIDPLQTAQSNHQHTWNKNQSMIISVCLLHWPDKGYSFTENLVM